MQRFFVTIVLLLPSALWAQFRIVSPRPNGLLQVRGNHALLHFRAQVPASYQNISIKLSSDVDTTSPFVGTTPIAARDGWIDTILSVPKSLRNYAIWYFADSNGAAIQGSVAGLTPGHIFGIAGQSNAVGFNYGMFDRPDGDVRMLVNDLAWERAHEPTGHVAGGPWIDMANELSRMLDDSLPIGIVNVAVGATGLTMVDPSGGQWVRNSANPEDSSIYGNAIRQLKKTGGQLEALLWIQGESDCFTLSNPQMYRDAFENLMAGFHSDLNDTFPIFHLQISGRSYPGIHTMSYPVVREAERLLLPSTMVGTAIGRPMEDDGVHFAVPTIKAVARMFADAILVERYGKSGTHLYPPVLPLDTARFDSLQQGNITQYCFSLQFHRSKDMSALKIVTGKQYFAIYRDGVQFDTSQVWYQISSKDSTQVLIGLRMDSVTPDHEWSITYDATAGADEAPLAIFDPVTRDTIFVTAFDKIPVNAPRKKLSVEADRIDVLPTPTTDLMNCRIFAHEANAINLRLFDERGVERLSSKALLHVGEQRIPVSTEGLASGRYWLEISGEGRKTEVVKTIIIR